MKSCEDIEHPKKNLGSFVQICLWAPTMGAANWLPGLCFPSYKPRRRVRGRVQLSKSKLMKIGSRKDGLVSLSLAHLPSITGPLEGTGI
jgi:hypothetical protein